MNRRHAARARAHLKAQRPRFPVPKEHGLEVAAAFFAATRNGDMGRLRSLLATDVIAQAQSRSLESTKSCGSRFRSRASSPRACRDAALPQSGGATDVAAFALGISIATGVLFGLVPGFSIRRANLDEILKAGSRSLTADSAARLRSVLVVGETALAFAPMVAAGLTLRCAASWNWQA